MIMTELTGDRAMTSRRPSSQAKAHTLPPLTWAAGSVLAVAAVIAAGQVRAESHETVIESHGYTNFGELLYPADFEHLAYVNPDAPKGGEIAIWAQGTFDSFNNYARDGVAAALPTIYYENIMVSTADDAYGSYCYLCTTIEYPESRDWVIFNLRDDVTFQDGRPMTAEDVAFSFNLILEQGIVEYRSVVESYIDTVEILGPYEIKFTFTDEAPVRDRVTFAGGTPVFSKSWFEETGTRLDESSDAPFLGTGPYVLESFDYNRQIVLARDPDWWGADHPLNVGQNNFDRIRVEYFADASAALEGFKAAEYTFRTENSSRDWATGYDFPAVADGYVVRETIPSGNIGSGQAFVFNLDRENWQDIRVRQAIEMMFNFEWSNETLFYGLYDRTNGFWQNSDLAATGTPSPEEVAILQPLVDEGLLDASILTDEVVMPTVNRASENQPERAVYREAAALMEAAGWEVGADGMLVKDGRPMTLVFLQASPLFDRIVNPYIENLRRLGVDARLERVDYAQYVERTRTGDYDLVNSSPGQGFEPGSGLKQWFDSSTAGNSSRNLMNLRDPAIDRLLPIVINAQTLVDMVPAVHALDRVLRATRFWVPQWNKGESWVAYFDMYRHPDTLPPYATGELSWWWYDAEAAEALRAAGAIR
jgi:microcin C transport system substrate-binding protein